MFKDNCRSNVHNEQVVKISGFVRKFWLGLFWKNMKLYDKIYLHRSTGILKCSKQVVNIYISLLYLIIDNWYIIYQVDEIVISRKFKVEF